MEFKKNGVRVWTKSMYIRTGFSYAKFYAPSHYIKGEEHLKWLNESIFSLTYCMVYGGRHENVCQYSARLRADSSTVTGNKEHLFSQTSNRSWHPLGFQLKGQGQLCLGGSSGKWSKGEYPLTSDQCRVWE
jgi:hypothetical protein